MQDDLRMPYYIFFHLLIMIEYILIISQIYTYIRFHSRFVKNSYCAHEMITDTIFISHSDDADKEIYQYHTHLIRLFSYFELPHFCKLAINI